MKRAKRLTRKQRGQHSAAVPYGTRPGSCNCHWRRAIRTIARTERDPTAALARKLGDEIVMLPLAVQLLKVEAEERKSKRINLTDYTPEELAARGIFLQYGENITRDHDGTWKIHQPKAAGESEAARG